MGGDQKGLQDAQQAAWKRVRTRMSAIREDMLMRSFDHGDGQQVIHDCAMFLIRERRYEAARAYLALLIDLDRANYAIEHPDQSTADDAPDYLRSED